MRGFEESGSGDEMFRSKPDFLSTECFSIDTAALRFSRTAKSRAWRTEQDLIPSSTYYTKNEQPSQLIHALLCIKKFVPNNSCNLIAGWYSLSGFDLHFVFISRPAQRRRTGT